MRILEEHRKTSYSRPSSPCPDGSYGAPPPLPALPPQSLLHQPLHYPPPFFPPHSILPGPGPSPRVPWSNGDPTPPPPPDPNHPPMPPVNLRPSLGPPTFSHHPPPPPFSFTSFPTTSIGSGFPNTVFVSGSGGPQIVPTQPADHSTPIITPIITEVQDNQEPSRDAESSRDETQSLQEPPQQDCSHTADGNQTSPSRRHGAEEELDDWEAELESDEEPWGSPGKREYGRELVRALSKQRLELGRAGDRLQVSDWETLWQLRREDEDWGSAASSESRPASTSSSQLPSSSGVLSRTFAAVATRSRGRGRARYLVHSNYAGGTLASAFANGLGTLPPALGFPYTRLSSGFQGNRTSAARATARRSRTSRVYRTRCSPSQSRGAVIVCIGVVRRRVGN